MCPVATANAAAAAEAAIVSLLHQQPLPPPLPQQSPVDQELQNIFDDINQNELKNALAVLGMKNDSQSFNVHWENSVTQLNNALVLAYNQNQDTSAFTFLFNMVSALREDIQNIRQALCLVLTTMVQDKDQENVTKKKRSDAARAKANQRANEKKRKMKEEEQESKLEQEQQHDYLTKIAKFQTAAAAVELKPPAKKSRKRV